MSTLVDAATADGRTLLATVLILWAAGYVLACLLFPYKACTWCSGGKHRSPSGRAFRACWRCGGSGKQLRLGAVVASVLGRPERRR